MARMNSRSDRGQALVLIVLSAVLIFGAVGLVVDTGWARFRQQAAQAAADSAALAAAQWASNVSTSPTCGSNGVICQSATACPTSLTSPATTSVQAGCLYAQQNGFTAGGKQNVTIAANVTTPFSNAAVNYWVTASVTETQTELFSAVFGNRFLNAGAHATAAIVPTGGGGCIYVMQATGSSVTNSGNALIDSGCGIYINSNGPSPVTMSGTSTIETTGGAKTNIVSSSEGTFSGSATITPAPNLGTSAVLDPFISMPAPSIGSCTYSAPVVVTSNTTLPYGTYCGGIITSGTETITLSPGLYIIEGGITESGSPTFTGTGVTLYFKTGGIVGSGTGTFNLSAPTTGTYQGVVLFEDRSNSSGITLSGSTGTQVSGLVYMPAGNLTYSGDSGTSGVVTTLVVNAITFSGTSYINQAATTAYGGGGGGSVKLIQ
jgi:Flp pilus assembly protein TadG